MVMLCLYNGWCLGDSHESQLWFWLQLCKYTSQMLNFEYVDNKYFFRSYQIRLTCSPLLKRISSVTVAWNVWKQSQTCLIWRGIKKEIIKDHSFAECVMPHSVRKIFVPLIRRLAKKRKNNHKLLIVFYSSMK